MSVINVKFVSEWNHETKVITDAKYDKESKKVFDIEPSSQEIEGVVTREYIILPDGSEKEVEYDHSDPESDVHTID
jgi:hypothetical protein